jgi:sulfate transport system permease protein
VGGRGSPPPSRPAFLGTRHGTTTLRVGAATIWLSVIVLLPLAAIVWQSAKGGWAAFWTAVTSTRHWSRSG